MNEFDCNNNNDKPTETTETPVTESQPTEKPQEPAQENQPQENPQPQQNPYFQGFAERTPDPKPSWQSQPQQTAQPAQQQNPYTPYSAYKPAETQYRQTSGEITYTPAQTKKKKEKKGVSAGAVAAILLVAALISFACGFGGALLAKNLVPTNAKTTTPAAETRMPTMTLPEDPVIVYRSAETVPTSVDAADGEALTYAQVAALVKEAVVEITTEYTTTSRWYQYTTGGAGSGVIISEDGYVITNAHVITDEESGGVADSITVRLANAEEYTATVVGYDADADIAIIKIEATGLKAAVCGDSSKLVVGEELIVVGNPLGRLGGTVTNGIVSATEREIQVNGVTMSLIQTNAAVNPGNSGGGVFNMLGQLVGIVNAKSSGSDVEGLGFAIPINDAMATSEQLLTYGYVRGKPYIGVNFTVVDNSSSMFFFGGAYNVKNGVYVDYLIEGYNDKTLKVGDRIVAVNEETVSSSADIKAIVMKSAIGDVLKFQVERSGKLVNVDVTVYERPPETDTSADLQFEEETGPETSEPGGLMPDLDWFWSDFFR